MLKFDAEQVLELESIYAQSKEVLVQLSDGSVINSIPMDLSVPMSRVILDWHDFRGFETRELQGRSRIDHRRLDLLLSGNVSLPEDDEIERLAKALKIPSGVLVTRATPEKVLGGKRFHPVTERAKLPKIRVYFERSYGSAILTWGDYFGLTASKLGSELGVAAERMRLFEMKDQSVPQDLEVIAERMQEKFNLPPGVIFTRAVPTDVLVEK